MFKHLTFSLGLGATALALSGAAMAHVDVGLNIGVPAPVYVSPAPVYAPPPASVITGPGLVIGWQGDRYWDGHVWQQGVLLALIETMNFVEEQDG
jgi:hypothetical protein